MKEAVIYRNQSTDLQSKSMDWFLYDNGLRLAYLFLAIVNTFLIPLLIFKDSTYLSYQLFNA